jgi:class 3 adenylate cyclase
LLFDSLFDANSHPFLSICNSLSDIVGFTDISRKMSSLKVCHMLERLYEEFDKLARAYKVRVLWVCAMDILYVQTFPEKSNLSFKPQVFKVETIGDGASYLSCPSW